MFSRYVKYKIYMEYPVYDVLTKISLSHCEISGNKRFDSILQQLNHKLKLFVDPNPTCVLYSIYECVPALYYNRMYSQGKYLYYVS